MTLEREPGDPAPAGHGARRLVLAGAVLLLFLVAGERALLARRQASALARLDAHDVVVGGADFAAEPAADVEPWLAQLAAAHDAGRPLLPLAAAPLVEGLGVSWRARLEGWDPGTAIPVPDVFRSSRALLALRDELHASIDRALDGGELEAAAERLREFAALVGVRRDGALVEIAIGQSLADGLAPRLERFAAAGPDAGLRARVAAAVAPLAPASAAAAALRREAAVMLVMLDGALAEARAGGALELVTGGDRRRRLRILEYYADLVEALASRDPGARVQALIVEVGQTHSASVLRALVSPSTATLVLGAEALQAELDAARLALGG